MAIQVRRGLRKDFDPQKMLPGEWAVSIDNSTQNQIVWMCFAAGVVKRMGTYEDFMAQIAEATDDIRNEYIDALIQAQTQLQIFTESYIQGKVDNEWIPALEEFAQRAETAATSAETSEKNAKTSETNAKESEDSSAESATIATEKASDAEDSANAAAESAETASDKAKEASDYATKAESWAHGGTDTREGEDENNAKEYARQAKESADKAAEIVGGDYIPNSDKGKAGGVATLGSDGKVPSKQLPEIESLNITLQQLQGIYEGRDLTKVFADEISDYSDEWAWIKARIKAHNFDEIYVCDYIPLTVNGETHQMQVAGIDTYYRTTDQELGHHIDFISRDCYSQTVRWNTTNNNGNAISVYPYMVSNLKSFLDTLYDKLPQAVKNVITEKRMLLEKRYSESGLLTNSTGWGWQSMGYLWALTEYEVFGSVVHGTKAWSSGQAVQYPIFANSYKNRIKCKGTSKNRYFWLLACVASESNNNICFVDDYGSAESSIANYERIVPICFRIDES